MQKFFVIFLLYILFLVQLCFFVHFHFQNQVPNLILISLLFFIFFEKPEENFSFLIAALGGLFSDIFSSSFLGIQILIFFLLTFLLKQVVKTIHKLHIFWFLSFLISSLIFTNTLSYFIYDFPFFHITSFSLHWGEIFSIPEILYNLIFGTVSFYLFLFARKYVLETSRKF